MLKLNLVDNSDLQKPQSALVGQILIAINAQKLQKGHL